MPKKSDLDIACIVIKQNSGSFDLRPADEKLKSIIIFGTPSGRMRRARLVPGDSVVVRLSPHKCSSGKHIGTVIARVNKKPNTDV